MAGISDKMLERGHAAGLTPNESESATAFGSRVRRAEKANDQPAQESGKGYWRRGVWIKV
tara:strand:+ start:321 stop:500 length:180 start_codon:yes stop_codon:yes gene_type:complete